LTTEMFSMISTYFWGDESEQVVPDTENIEDSAAEIESDWILVNVNDKSEHPSMSVYGPLASAPEAPVVGDGSEASPQEGEDEVAVRRPTRNSTRAQQQLKVIEHTKQIANERRTKISSRNRATKRQNLVHHHHGKRSKRNKRMDRKDGKHVGMVGKRAS